MELDQLIDGIDKGKYTATLFTQKNCRWCGKMKESIIELDIPAKEVSVDAAMIDAFDLKVTPTLLITSESNLDRINGFMSSSDLKQSIQDLTD